VTCYVIVIVKVLDYIDTSTSVKSNYNTHYLNTYCKLTNIYFQQKLDITKNLEFQVLYYSTSQASYVVDHVHKFLQTSTQYACLILFLAVEAFKFQAI